MIAYEHGRWGVLFIFRLSGSVFPKALIWAMPAAVVSMGVHLGMWFLHYRPAAVSAGSVIAALGSFISVLGFMVVFRSNQAWSRYWEGAELVSQMRGQWYNATSSLFAFCSRKPEKQKEVLKFQADLVRMVSLLFTSALESLSGCSLVMLDQEKLNAVSKTFFQTCNDGEFETRCEVVYQWIQRHIVHAVDAGVVDIPPPILSRAFQELSMGLVNLAAARKINELPFPFHFAQMLTAMLLTYTIGTSIASGFVMPSWWAAGGATFFNVLVLWSVNYLAAEIEQPFGTDLNDLPIDSENLRMNCLLRILLHEQALTPAAYDDEQEEKMDHLVHNLRGSRVSETGQLLEWEPVTISRLSMQATELFTSPSMRDMEKKGGYFSSLSNLSMLGRWGSRLRSPSESELEQPDIIIAPPDSRQLDRIEDENCQIHGDSDDDPGGRGASSRSPRRSGRDEGDAGVTWRERQRIAHV